MIVLGLSIVVKADKKKGVRMVAVEYGTQCDSETKESKRSYEEDVRKLKETAEEIRKAEMPDRGSYDPWKHRGAKMRCLACMWFVEKVTRAVQMDGACLGRCRRHAPTMNGYPVVYQHDWCGDHKVDECKI